MHFNWLINWQATVVNSDSSQTTFSNSKSVDRNTSNRSDRNLNTDWKTFSFWPNCLTHLEDWLPDSTLTYVRVTRQRYQLILRHAIYRLQSPQKRAESQPNVCGSGRSKEKQRRKIRKMRAHDINHHPAEATTTSPMCRLFHRFSSLRRLSLRRLGDKSHHCAVQNRTAFPSFDARWTRSCNFKWYFVMVLPRLFSNKHHEWDWGSWTSCTECFGNASSRWQFACLICLVEADKKRAMGFCWNRKICMP